MNVEQLLGPKYKDSFILRFNIEHNYPRVPSNLSSAAKIHVEFLACKKIIKILLSVHLLS